LPENRIITLTTDFGVNDHYVGAMRGVILNIHPQAQIVDICNTIPSFDILEGAMTVAQAYHYFPTNTVNMVIVDPGVGTSRHPLLVATERHYFLAPDNGVLSLVYEQESRITVRRIDAAHYFLQPVSQTFQGRDIFAPVAGWLSKGVDPSNFGEITTEYVRFSMPHAKIVDECTMKAVVLKADRFGNLITNLRPEDLPQLFPTPKTEFKIFLGAVPITKIKHAYGEGVVGELFALVGSMGYIEIAANRGSAAALTQAGKGSEVRIVFSTPQFTPPAAL
jgi:hypothetical protein